MSLTEELAAIQDSAAILPISRGFLRISGPDATRWLNGMVTNSIQSLAPGEGNYNFLLNAQGRIMGTCTIYRELDEEPTFLLETDAAQVETIHRLLDKFIIMDDVELTPALADQSGVLVIGTEARRTLDLGFMWPPEPISLSYGDSLEAKPLILSVAKNQYEIWSGSDLSWICGLGDEISPEALEAHRILTGTPRYGTDIRNSDTAKDLPQETAQTHALHFAKGCYLGQEIVERIRSRGQVHRTFTRFTLTPDSGEPVVPTLPAKLTSTALSKDGEAKPAGELTSAVLIGDTLHALGYIRRELLETHATITYPGGTATPT